MEDKIEVGEYVRTDEGYIAKLIERDIEDEDVKDGMLFDNYIHKDHKQMRESGIRKCCKKHSKNIIDLIEIGDYVNRMLVTEIGKMHKVINIYFYNGLYASNLTLVEADIKSIVTKEMMESIEYRVE